MGGYTLMSICCVFFTVALTFQVIHFVDSVSSLDMHDYRSHSSSFPQAASPVIPYISMACVFAFILSFGLGPGKEPEYSFCLSPSNQLQLLVPHTLPPSMQVE